MSNYYSLSNKERLKLLSRKEALAVRTIQPPDFIQEQVDTSSIKEGLRAKSQVTSHLPSVLLRKGIKPQESRNMRAGLSRLA